MMITDSVKSSDEQFMLRYSGKVCFYFIWFGGTLTIATSTLLLHDFDWHILFRHFDFMNQNLLFALVLFAIIIFAVAMFTLPFILALYITDNKASVTFTDTEVVINKQIRTVGIKYSNIKRIKFVNVVTQSYGKIYLAPNDKKKRFNLACGYGPYLYRIVIYTSVGKYKIHCSFREAWGCRRKNIPPTVYNFTRKLENQTGVTPEFTINAWG